jgi:hypothetical protein
MHISSKYYIIYYYSPTCFGRFCDHHNGVTEQYKQYTNNRKNVQLKTPDVTIS